MLNGLDASKPDPLVLTVSRDGVPVQTETVTSNDHVLSFHTTQHGRYRLQLQRGFVIEVVSSPIWFEPLPPRPARAAETPTTPTRAAGECKE